MFDVDLFLRTLLYLKEINTTNKQANEYISKIFNEFISTIKEVRRFRKNGVIISYCNIVN